MADLDFVPDQQQKAMVALASPMYNHPRHWKAKRIDMSDYCTKRPPHVIFVDLMRFAKRQVCMYVCMRVDETKWLAGKSDATSWSWSDLQKQALHLGRCRHDVLLWHSSYVRRAGSGPPLEGGAVVKNANNKHTAVGICYLLKAST